MAATAGSGDAWRISGEDRAKHDSQFFTLKPINGFITGDQARGFFMQSGLPTAVLGQIWGLADMNNDGKMDKKEFSIAMHLIKKKLQGYELPKSLPPQLKADPSPVMGSFGSLPSQAAGMMGMTPGMGMSMGPQISMMANGLPQMMPAPGYMGGSPMPVQPGGFAGALSMRTGTPPVASGNLAIPHQGKLKYTQLFNTHDRNKRGSLTGVEARSILVQTGVPQQMLAQIWNLSDIDKDGKLDCEEFCIAMHLTDVVKMGHVLPTKLPPELLAGKARSGSFGSPTPMAIPAGPGKDSFGDLLGGMGMQQPVQPVTNGDGKVEEVQDMSPVTFEDKRKQNFDKGQAELERRRQQLQEQMRKENEARLEKERKEQEKREKQRQEQEMKRQQELERQLEKQRAIEREKEEQRRKMMEQREAARRELERQRQMEWERQRKEQLMAEKAREYEQLSALKSQSSNLQGELELLQGKKSEISGKISQVKNGVTDFTAHIEAMRSTRDLKNNDIDRLQRELQELNQKLHTVQSERENLDLRVQTSVQTNPMSETHRTMMHSVELKKTSLQRLKKDLEQIEKDTEAKLAEIDNLNTQLKEFSDSVANLQKDLSKAEASGKERAQQQAEEQTRQKQEKDKHDKLRRELEAQRKMEENAIKSEKPKASDSGGNWFAFGGDSQTSSGATDNWASVFDTQQGGSSQQGTIDWGASFSDQAAKKGSDKTFRLSGSKQKYQALYQFDARNVDELSLKVGDTVWVFDDQIGAEPGWKGGEMNGVCGWFPEAYVERATADSNQPGAEAGAGLMSSEDSSFMTVPVKVPAVSPTPGQGQAAPDGLQAQALYPWKAKKENHLTFNKGDIISVREQQDMWWSGELAGKVGWFPKSYVKLISGPSAVTSTSSGMASPVVPVAGTSPQPAANGTQSPAADIPAGETYIALYTYQSSEPEDLVFNQGEIIMVIKKDGDWWTGKLRNKTGIFPANYVKKHEQPPQPDTMSPSSADQPALLADSAGPAPASTGPSPEPSDTKPKAKQAPAAATGTLKKPEIATVIAAYQATGEEQLSLSPGQLIQVRKKSPSGWWEGELQARGQKRKIGWFPANYVKLLQASARNTPDNMLGASGKSSPAQSGNRSANPSPAPQTATSPPATHSYVDHVIALYPYTALNPDELTFQKDAVINVIKKDDPDWWQGELNGQVGMFPSNYVQSSTPESTSWSNDPAVLALTSKEEGKRQSYIHELINTEETYMSDMSIVLDAFYKPLKEGGGLNEEQLQQIFVNWKDLIVCNTKLQKALRVRKKMCGYGQVIKSIGDILCENIPHLTPYIRFCSCQLNAAALLQKISETNPTFNEIHKKCVQNPKTKGMPLSSFLLKPMQRITKYPLLVEKILKHTPEGHPDHSHLQEALERCQELCSQVNEGVREKENSDRLEWIQQRIHCDGLPEKITFNSVTNCLGPRKLLHTGVVYKAKSNKELAAFMFNDFLLLTTSNRPLNSSTHSLFDTTGSVQYRMYKSPIILNEVMIKKDGQEDPEAFTVCHIERMYNLRCHSQSERDTWVRKLDAASRHYLETDRKKREKAISLRRDPGVGRLLVVIVEGKDLKACDDNGKSDPYCEVSMGAQEHKTKVINNTLNPKWNSSMQFTIRDIDMDALCITVFDRDLFSPNDFLGRTEIRVKDILHEAKTKGRGPIQKKLLLHEVATGEVIVKLDLHLYDQT